MNDVRCHAGSRKDTIKAIVLDVLGVKRVADWCAVSDAAVYQWLSRATDASPFPVKHVPRLLACARRDGVSFDRAPFLHLLGLEEPAP